jgi:hypothetical protein
MGPEFQFLSPAYVCRFVRNANLDNLCPMWNPSQSGVRVFAFVRFTISLHDSSSSLQSTSAV